MLHRVFARAKQVGDGHVDERSKDQAGALDPGPQPLDVIEAVLLRAVQVAVDAGVREIRNLMGDAFSFFSETLDHGSPSLAGAVRQWAEHFRC